MSAFGVNVVTGTVSAHMSHIRIRNKCITYAFSCMHT